MDEEKKCPNCNSELYYGWSPVAVINNKDDREIIEIEVEWCNKCEIVVHVCIEHRKRM